MIDLVIFLPLFTMGLVSSAHCIGMCGGIMGALTMAIPSDAKAKRWIILVAYNLGRITSYMVMGLLAGLFAEQFAALGGGMILRILAGILLIAMGLYLADWWRGLTRLESIGRYLWVYIQPLGKRLMPVNSLPKALLLGVLWGWLPCGLVYAALAMAMTQPAPLLAAGAMLAFGLGTLPAVLAAGVAAQQLTRILQQRQVRMGMALIIIVFGIWTIWGSLGHGHNHQHVQSSQSPESVDYGQMNHEEMSHEGMNQSVIDHSKMDHANMNHSSTPALARQRTEIEESIMENRSSIAYDSSSAASTETSHHHH